MSLLQVSCTVRCKRYLINLKTINLRQIKYLLFKNLDVLCFKLTYSCIKKRKNLITILRPPIQHKISRHQIHEIFYVITYVVFVVLNNVQCGSIFFLLNFNKFFIKNMNIIFLSLRNVIFSIKIKTTILDDIVY